MFWELVFQYVFIFTHKRQEKQMDIMKTWSCRRTKKIYKNCKLSPYLSSGLQENPLMLSSFCICVKFSDFTSTRYVVNFFVLFNWVFQKFCFCIALLYSLATNFNCTFIWTAYKSDLAYLFILFCNSYPFINFPNSYELQGSHSHLLQFKITSCSSTHVFNLSKEAKGQI